MCILDGGMMFHLQFWMEKACNMSILKSTKHIKKTKKNQKKTTDNILGLFVNCYHVILFWNREKQPGQLRNVVVRISSIWSLLNAACYCATYSFVMSKLVKSMNPVIVGLNGCIAGFSCCSPGLLRIRGNQRLSLNIKWKFDQMETQRVHFKLHFRVIGSCGARDMEILPFPHKLGPLSVSLQDCAPHTDFLFSAANIVFT